MLAAVFLGALDQTVIATALPAMVVDLQIPFDNLDQAAWIVSGYLLGYTVALPLMGQVADSRGPRLALGIALGLFAAGSAVCAVSPTLALLIVGRVVQAAGGGALVPVAITVVSNRFPSSNRIILIGIVGAIAEAGGVLGPLYGAIVVNALSWRWIFWFNLPLGAACLVVGWRGLARQESPRHPLDLRGAALVAAAIGALIAGLSHESVLVAGIDARPGLFLASLVLLAGFIAHAARAPYPLIDLRLFRRRAFAAATAGAFLLGAALIVAMVDVPLYAATVLSAAPADGGLLLLRLTALIPVGAIAGALLGRANRFATPTLAGFVIAAAGLAGMSQWGASPTNGAEWLPLAVAGAGFGLLIAPLTTVVVEVSGMDRAASAASTFTVARLTGMTVGLSALTSLGLRRFDDLAGSIQLPLPAVGESTATYQNRLLAYQQALVQAGSEVYHEIFLVTAVVCLLGLIVGLLLWSENGSNPTASERP